MVYDRGEVVDMRAEHPLAAVMPALRAMLVTVADEAEHVMIVTDADGHLLWREGSAKVCVRADKVNLTEGTRWTEDAIGTNAMGTAIAVNGPVMIHAAEHLVRTYHPWTCAAAPVHDPDTGQLIGVIDVTGPASTMHASTLALVSTAAHLVESQLRLNLLAQDERLRTRNMRHLSGAGQGALLSHNGRVVAASCPSLPSKVDTSRSSLWLPDGREAVLEPLAEGYLLRLVTTRRLRPPLLSLSFLGTGEPTALLEGREVPLTLRHAEILTLLALSPKGLTAEQLALALYGECGNPVTARAEIHRLRMHLGADVARTRPYRLDVEVDADFIRLRELLRERRAREAVELWRGPLLPRSTAPGICAEREEVLTQLRTLVIERGDRDTLWSFGRVTPDQTVLEALLRSLPTADQRHGWAQATLRKLVED
ncbi:hypothetical protein GCM10029964_006050 [Kibdelosporangium lantanae]